jgi:nucleoside-diphosphate-sugar epimerase
MRLMVTGGSGFIGTNVVSHFIAHGHPVCSLDVAAPTVPSHRPHWMQIDIGNEAALVQEIRRFAPTHLVHLAGAASFDTAKEDLDLHNVKGTESVLNAALHADSLERIIVTSTQYVRGPGTSFEDDLAYNPINDYGKSKVAVESLTRSGLYGRLPWVIVRPTIIWGPHHPTWPLQLLRYIKSRRYVHPGGAPVKRAYGYVGNLVRQVELLLRSAPHLVVHRVFYLTDPIVDSYEFLNRFSLALTGRPIRRVPRPLLRAAALAGDGLKGIGVTAPFHSERFRRMTTDYEARDETLWSSLGYEPVPLADAIATTITWLKQAYPQVYH